MYKQNKEKLDLDFILFFFKTKQGKHLLGLASPGGAGRNKTLGQKEFGKLTIPLPPFPEQRKIASILSTWDNAIERTEQLIQAKQKLKKGLMQQLLTGKRRFREFQEEEWKEVKLGEIANCRSGGTPLTTEKNYYNGTIPWVIIEDMTNTSKYIFFPDCRLG